MAYNSTEAQQSGYTLVELSISIIIIGLLIGAITAGTTLMQQAEVRTIIADLRNFQTYYSTFKTTYDAVPGDFKAADTYWSGTTCHATVSTACNGDGDNLIRWRDVATTAAGTGDEAGRALKHLSLSGIMPFSIGQLTATYAGGLNELSTATQLIPPSSSVNVASCIFFAYNTVAVATTTDAIGENASATGFLASPWAATSKNAVFMGAKIQTANKSCVEGIVTPTQAFNIDQKMDDGAFDSSGNGIGTNTGNFRTTWNLSVYGDGTDCLTSFSSGNYNLTAKNTRKGCVIGLVVD